MTHLPPDSAVARTGPDDHVWTDARQGSADVADVLIGLFAKEKTPVKRPGNDLRKQSVEDRAMAKATLHQQRAEARRRAREQGV